jgi:hypothetical protein
MQKTGRDLLGQLSERLGGPKGLRLRAALEKPLLRDLKALDEPLADAEFSERLEKMANPGPSGSWGMPN